MTIAGAKLSEGDWITLNGSKGNIYAGQLEMVEVGENNESLNAF